MVLYACNTWIIMVYFINFSWVMYERGIINKTIFNILNIKNYKIPSRIY